MDGSVLDNNHIDPANIESENRWNLSDINQLDGADSVYSSVCDNNQRGEVTKESDDMLESSTEYSTEVEDCEDDDIEEGYAEAERVEHNDEEMTVQNAIPTVITNRINYT